MVRLTTLVLCHFWTVPVTFQMTFIGGLSSDDFDDDFMGELIDYGM